MYAACVVNVLIASPSDTEAERQVLREAIQRWNDRNAHAQGVVLLPIMWETHSYPAVGRPQGIINSQIVDDSDVLVATFWTRLGTDTGEAESGTVEEIRRFVESSRPVLLYFSERPVQPTTLDTAQLDAVKQFRRDIEGQALIGAYDTPERLDDLVSDALSRTIDRLRAEGALCEQVGGTTPAVDQSGSDSSSLPQSEYRRALQGWIVRWNTVWRGLETSDDVNRMQLLMSEVNAHLLDTVRNLSVVQPDAPVIEKLGDLAEMAYQAADTPVFLDGGASRAGLILECKEILRQLKDVVTVEW